MTAALIVAAVTVRILANSLANVFQKKLIGKVENAFLINAAVYALLSLGLLPWALFQPLNELPAVFWLWAAAMGLCGACGNAFMVKALEHGELSVLGPINAWKPVVGMVGGIFLLAELPSAGGMAGLALIVWGSSQVLGADGDGFHWRILLRRDILFRILALLFTAVEAVFIKRVILLSSAELAFLMWCWMGMAFSMVGAGSAGKTVVPAFRRLMNGRDVMLLLLLALCFGAMQFSTNVAFRLLPVGPALALFQLSAVVNLWLGWRLFRETGMRRKIFGTAFTVAGAVLIILFP